uniref:E3 ubiquitin-protein ligase RNF31 n=2 Tax=Lygus hesperus TaxID=30085 RepID=A0A0K8T469_LYGHE
MLHLNLIGNNKTIEKLEALSNLSKTEKRDLRARRTSDVHRYLTQFFTLNDNSLKISKSFTSMQDVNKPQKENTNTLYKFLERNIGFASSGTLLTISTTSSNIQAKSIGTDFDTDSLNEDRSGDGAISEKTDASEKPSQINDVKIEIEEEHDEDNEERGAIDKEKDKSLADKEAPVEPVVIDHQLIEDNSSPVRQIFVKSITVSSEGSIRSVSPQQSQKFGSRQSSETSSSGSGSFESVDEDSEGNDEVDMNLDRNSESKDMAVLGKLILREEMSPVPTTPLTTIEEPGNGKQQEPTAQLGGGSGVTEGQVDPDDDNLENEEEIMQMVENLIQKTEFMQEDQSAESNKSISVMYTNQDLGVSNLSLKKSNSSSPVTEPDDAGALPAADETSYADEGGKYDKEVEGVMKQLVGTVPNKEEIKSNKNEVIEVHSKIGNANDENIDNKEDKMGSGSGKINEMNYEQPLEVEIAGSEIRNLNEASENNGDINANGILDNYLKTENIVNVANVIVNENVAKNLDIPADLQVTENGIEDNTENEIFEEPPEIMSDALTGEDIFNVVVENELDINREVSQTMGQGSAKNGSIKIEDESSGLKETEDVQPPINVESSSGTPQTALNMAETDSKSIATNKLQTSEGNSERDVSPIPTDSEKDPSSKFHEEGHKLSRAKSSYELSMGEVIENNAKLARTASSNELVNLLRESLAKDDVVERIVSSLFQSVLRANEFQLPSHSRDASLLRSRHGSSLSRDMSFRGSTESERDDSELYYEAVETREIQQGRRGRRQFRRRGRNAKRRGTPKKTDESSIISTSTDNYSNRDGNSRSTSPADIVDYIDETEREARRLLAEGIVSSYDRAELVVQLKALNFNQEDALLAAKECSSMESAIAFLQQDCDLCAGKYCMKQMVSMLECEHMCCRDCAQNYFTLQITERSVGDCVCPFCKEPEIGRMEEDAALDYFAHLDIFLKALVAPDAHELFQRKLRDRTLMSDPHFKWCIKCSSGFIANPKQRKLICPDCRTITCANCRRAWEKEHEKMTCEEFAAFKNEEDAEENQVEKQLAEGGVTCPKCHQRYLLAKGGCMHLTCPGCKHEFCSGCSKPFLMGAKCAVSANCERLGLHSHHPRNCLFYLRDKDPPILEQLLQEHGVELAKESEPSSSRCKTQLLKETTDGLVEASCGHPVEGAGLCRTHYIEHLVDLVKTNKIDPVGVMDATDAVQELRRHGKDLPIRADFPSDKDYLTFCIKIISEEIPLE